MIYEPGIYDLDIGRKLEYYENSFTQVVFQGIIDYSWSGVKEKTAHFSIEGDDNLMHAFSLNRTEMEQLSWFIQNIIIEMDKKGESNES